MSNIAIGFKFGAVLKLVGVVIHAYLCFSLNLEQSGRFARYVLRNMRVFMVLIVCLLCLSCEKQSIDNRSYKVVQGFVTDEETNEPISGVVVSAGLHIDRTDNNGFFSIQTYDDSRFVSVSLPVGYEVPVRNGIPILFSDMGNRKDSVFANFLLKKRETDNSSFSIVVVSDPQVRDENTYRRFLNESISDIARKYEKSEKDVFGFVLGDIVHDDLTFFQRMRDAIVSTKVPFFYVIGNHDYEKGKELGSQAFQDNFGPLNYSFNLDGVHIVVMNNVLYQEEGRFEVGFEDDQMRWFENNLAYINPNQLLLVMTHCPIDESISFRNKSRFYKSIQRFQHTLVLNGHSHLNRNILSSNMTNRIEHHTIGAASGAWWSSNYNRCGTPNGYRIYEFEDNRYTNSYYKSCFHESDFQFELSYDLNAERTVVIANVWNANELWEINAYDIGGKFPMERYSGYCPIVYSHILKEGRTTSSIYIAETDHLFRYYPSEGASLVRVVGEDMFGNEFFREIKIN